MLYRGNIFFNKTTQSVLVVLVVLVCLSRSVCCVVVKSLQALLKLQTPRQRALPSLKGSTDSTGVFV